MKSIRIHHIFYAWHAASVHVLSIKNYFFAFTTIHMLSMHILVGKIPGITAFCRDSLSIHFNFERSLEKPNILSIKMTATNEGPIPMTDFLFQAAVPKVM